jgi:hypothetical protein
LAISDYAVMMVEGHRFLQLVASTAAIHKPGVQARFSVINPGQGFHTGLHLAACPLLRDTKDIE